MKDHGYAFLAMKEAEKLNIKGIAGYTKENALDIEAEGEEANLIIFLTWCKSIASQINIHGVVSSYGKLRNFTDFTIFQQKAKT